MLGRTSRECSKSPPCGLEMRSEPPSLADIDGSLKQALETGRTRLLVAGLVFTLAFFSVGVRLVDVAFWQGFTSNKSVVAAHRAAPAEMRRPILDRHGVVLAASLPTASLYANPRQVRNPVAVARQLAAILPGSDAQTLADRLSSDRAFVWLKRNLTPRQHQTINGLGVPGLYFRQEQRRVYPHGELTAHVVGLTDIDSNGLTGIERSFDDQLRSAEAPVELSLDLRVQHILHEELAASMAEYQAIGAAGIVLDVHSGEVLGLASLPSFDPLRPTATDRDARFNRASLGVYELGSVFKIFTTAMALEEGVVTLRDGYDTSEPIRVARYTINDYKPKGRWLSVPEIFIYSSNIGTVQMAMELGTDTQRQYLARLGLTALASLELPEVGRPMLPTPWREINTMTVSYGHGMAVSPLQLASAVAAVVNGGVLVPATLLRRGPYEKVPGQHVFSPQTSEQMNQLLRLVVRHGTGRKADAPGYRVGGKTGTANKQLGGRYVRNARIASFVGAFPMEAPRYLVFAMLDEPKGTKNTHGYATGGWVAAPIIGQVVARLGPLLGVEPTPVETEAFEDEEIASLLTHARARESKLASN